MKQHTAIVSEPGTFFTLLVGAAVLALIVAAGDIAWLTQSLASDIAVLLILWRIFAYALAAGLVFLHRRFMAFWPGTPATIEAPASAEGEPAATAEPPDNEMFLRYLALRATLQWHYRADPYGKDGGEVAGNTRPTELILARHVCEKLAAWAERNGASLSDAAERMILNGMADEHLAHIVREGGWADREDQCQ